VLIKVKRPKYLRVVDPYAGECVRQADDSGFGYRVRNVGKGMLPHEFLQLESRMPGSSSAFYDDVLRRFGKHVAAEMLYKLAKAGHIRHRGPTRSGVDAYEMIARASLPGTLYIITDLLIEAIVARDNVSRRTAKRRAEEFMKAHAPSADELPTPTKAPVSRLVSTFDRKGHEAAVRKLQIETDPYKDKKAR
jgi:hypothetical protein